MVAVFVSLEKSTLGEVMAGHQQVGNYYMKLNTSANPIEWDIDSTLDSKWIWKEPYC